MFIKLTKKYPHNDTDLEFLIPIKDICSIEIFNGETNVHTRRVSGIASYIVKEDYIELRRRLNDYNLIISV
jgi:hypothetical protein